MMKIHKEGIKPIIIIILVLLLINVPLFIFSEAYILKTLVQTASLLLLLFFFSFFRKPTRVMLDDNLVCVAPCDGKVVVVEETMEHEYFKDRRIQISIFMSVWNVHINWFPVAGKIAYQKYHPGKFFVASLPKSSEENERSTSVVRNDMGKEILIRQIAGAVARRIITYGKQDQPVRQSEEMGFIRFGSRVDVFLPPDTEIYIQPGDIVTGGVTHMARF